MIMKRNEAIVLIFKGETCSCLEAGLLEDSLLNRVIWVLFES
jgi:hypothetical protein